MSLQLAHTKLEVYRFSMELVIEAYRVAKLFPNEERYCLTQQIRRAAVSVHLNLAEGCSRSSGIERRRFFEISQGSLIEVDTAIGLAFRLGYTGLEELRTMENVIIRTFKILTGMIGATGINRQE
jgi:four helix bundle protein